MKKSDPQMDDLFPESPEDDFDDGDDCAEYEIEHGAIPNGLIALFNHALISVKPKFHILDRHKMPTPRKPQFAQEYVEDEGGIDIEEMEELLLSKLHKGGSRFVKLYNTMVRLEYKPNFLPKTRLAESANFYEETLPIPNLTKKNNEF